MRGPQESENRDVASHIRDTVATSPHASAAGHRILPRRIWRTCERYENRWEYVCEYDLARPASSSYFEGLFYSVFDSGQDAPKEYCRALARSVAFGITPMIPSAPFLPSSRLPVACPGAPLTGPQLLSSSFLAR
jgi:hypothetical protein